MLKILLPPRPLALPGDRREFWLTPCRAAGFVNQPSSCPPFRAGTTLVAVKPVQEPISGQAEGVKGQGVPGPANCPIGSCPSFMGRKV
jgi:hypothetical protein